jgi:hypothetical protein
MDRIFTPYNPGFIGGQQVHKGMPAFWPFPKRRGALYETNHFFRYITKQLLHFADGAVSEVKYQCVKGGINKSRKMPPLLICL